MSVLFVTSYSHSLNYIDFPQSPKKVGDDIAKATKAWKGMNVTVKLICQNRNATVQVVPTASSMVVKALKEPERDRKKVKHVKHSGNISFDEILDIARQVDPIHLQLSKCVHQLIRFFSAGQMRPKSMAKELKGTVKEILGTAFSVGCTVAGKSPRDVQSGIDNGEAALCFCFFRSTSLPPPSPLRIQILVV